MFEHYVPLVYLRRFTDPSTPPGQEPYLWVYDSQTKESVRRAPRNVAGRTNYYECSSGPGIDIEARFSEIESRVKAELDRIHREGRDNKIFDDRLMWFLALLSVRTPWGRRTTEEHMERYPPSGPLSTLDLHERWCAAIEYLAWWAREYFVRMDWILIGPEDPTMYFVTSDRPVVFTGDHMSNSAMDLLMLTDKSAVVTVPLSPTMAMIGSYHRDEFIRTGVSVDWMNARTIENIERYVFAPSQDLCSILLTLE